MASGGLEFEIRAGVLPNALEPVGLRICAALVAKVVRAGVGSRYDYPAYQRARSNRDPGGFSQECRMSLRFLLVHPGDLDRGFGRPQSAVWDGRIVAGKASIETGRLQFGDRSVNALRIQMEEAVALFGLGPEGIVDLPKDTPAVWVTCPTREDQHFGFAVCGRFDVDPGRARLSRNAENRELAVRIGTLLGQRLRELRLAQWDTVRRDLGLRQGAIEYDFWASLWRLFQRTVAQPDSAVAAI